MSVLIKGMDMPEDCLHCRFVGGDDEHGVYCNFLDKFVEFKDCYRDKNCPLVNIKKPHKRLIEVTDRLMYEACAYEAWTGIDEAPVEFASSLLDRAPTIVEAEE